MSWNDYVNAMTNDNVCSAAYIIGVEDGSLWAGTSNNIFSTYQVDLPTETDPEKTEKVNVDEKTNFFAAFKNKGLIPDQQPPLKGGVRFGGEKYLNCLFDPERQVWYLKKAGGGACVASTKQAILIGVFDASKTVTSKNFPQNAGSTNEAVENLQKFLKESGF